jgi:hypothetical protein
LVCLEEDEELIETENASENNNISSFPASENSD